MLESQEVQEVRDRGESTRVESTKVAPTSVLVGPNRERATQTKRQTPRTPQSAVQVKAQPGWPQVVETIRTHRRVVPMTQRIIVRAFDITIALVGLLAISGASGVSGVV
jgi:hypothetical protein